MVEHSKSIIDEKNVRPFVSPQQKKQRRITIVIVLAVVALAVGAYFLLSPRKEVYTLRSYDTAVVTAGPMEQTTQASGTIVIPTQMEVRSPETGYARAIYVAEGDSVTAGQVIAEIDVPDLEQSLTDLENEYQTAVLSHEKTTVQNQISTAKSQRGIADLEKQVADAQTQVTKVQSLVAAQATSRSDLDSAQKTLSDLQEQLSEARIGLQDDQKLNAIDDKIQNANLESTRREIDRLKERIASAKITSPMTGEVLQVEQPITVVGTEIAANEALLIIADPKSAVADLEILEQYSAAVKTGDEVALSVSNTNMTGTVEQIGRVAQTSSSGLGSTIDIRVKPVDPPIALLSGATAVGTFVLGVQDNVLMLPRGPYLTTGSQRYVYVIDGDVANKRAVTFGQIEGNKIEVQSGLEAGEKIISSGYQNFIEYDTVRLAQGE